MIFKAFFSPVGGLLGDVFLHLLPETYQHVRSQQCRKEVIAIFFLYRTLTFFVCELYSICGQVIDSGEEGGLFRIGVATLTGVLAFLVLEKVLRLSKKLLSHSLSSRC